MSDKGIRYGGPGVGLMFGLFSTRMLIKLSANCRKEGDCWIWTGFVNDDGYGRVRCFGEMEYVHRVSFALYRHAIPKGLEVDHIPECTSRACFNPNHLRLASKQRNCSDGGKRRWANDW